MICANKGDMYAFSDNNSYNLSCKIYNDFSLKKRKNK